MANTSLATIQFQNVTPKKFDILKDNAIREFKAFHYSQMPDGTITGTIQDHGATADFKYSNETELVVTIEKIGTVFFHKPKVSDVEQGLIKWVEDTLAESAEQIKASQQPPQQEEPPAKPTVVKTEPLPGENDATAPVEEEPVKVVQNPVPNSTPPATTDPSNVVGDVAVEANPTTGEAAPAGAPQTEPVVATQPTTFTPKV